MTTTRSAFQSSTQAPVCVRPTGGLGFDLPVALLSLWLTTGLYLDGFVHHNLPDSIESFFTPWHGVLYSGFLALAGFLLFHQYRNMAGGYRWDQALPAGYSFALPGILLFFVGGLGDGIWHTIFGIEEGVEALLSPTHLLLAAGGALLVASPLRAALRRLDRQPRWLSLLPALLSALFLLSVVTFFTEYANTLASPERVAERLGDTQGNIFAWTALGVVGVLIPAALTTGVALFLIRRWTLPPGSLTLLITGNGLLMALFHYRETVTYPQVLLPIVASGVIADLLYGWLKPSPTRATAWHIFAFLTPFATFALFFAAMVSTTRVQWSVHLWTGVPVIAGVVGLLISIVATPPAYDKAGH